MAVVVALALTLIYENVEVIHSRSTYKMWESDKLASVMSH